MREVGAFDTFAARGIVLSYDPVPVRKRRGESFPETELSFDGTAFSCLNRLGRDLVGVFQLPRQPTQSPRTLYYE